MVFYLIRHGETDWNAGNLVQGWSESDLNEKGRRQADLLAQRLARPEERPTALYSSPLRRAAQTAEPTVRALGLEPAYDDGLMEMRCGSWEGLNFDDIRSGRREEFLSWATSPDNPIPGGGESIRDLYNRASKWMQGIVATHNDEDRIAVFTHGGVTRMLLAFLLGLDLQTARRCQQDNCSVNLFQQRAGMFFLTRWNDTSHLQGSEVARPLRQE